MKRPTKRPRRPLLLSLNREVLEARLDRLVAGSRVEAFRKATTEDPLSAPSVFEPLVLRPLKSRNAFVKKAGGVYLPRGRGRPREEDPTIGESLEALARQSWEDTSGASMTYAEAAESLASEFGFPSGAALLQFLSRDRKKQGTARRRTHTRRKKR